VQFAAVYLEAVDFVSISVALLGLIVFYDLTKNELKGRRPLAKFLCIKLIVMVTWYQSFLFSLLQTKGVIKATEFWTASNVADGLNALCTSVEMVLFAIFMWWAYPASEYYNRDPANPKELGYVPAEMSEDEKRRRMNRTTSVWRPLWDSINFSDFAIEIWSSFVFFVDYAMGKPYAHSHGNGPERTDFGKAFGIEEREKKKGKLVKSRGGPDQANVGLIRAKSPTSLSGTFANGSGSHGGLDDRTSEGGMGEAYRMSPITSQPRPRQDQQALGLPQTQPEQRWSTVGMAM
jgi:Organic solute transporter Ostalpha